MKPCIKPIKTDLSLFDAYIPLLAILVTLRFNPADNGWKVDRFVCKLFIVMAQLLYIGNILGI